MDDETLEKNPEQEIPPAESTPKRYVPRPKWQIAAAWLFLILMIFATLLYYYQVAFS